MATKTLKKKSNVKRENPVVESAREIWLAGLGAFAVAQDEGSKMFDKLVKEGGKLENKTRKSANDTAESLKDSVEGRVDNVRKQAKNNWDKLEKVFEERVARALSKLGVPTSDEINRLSGQVEKLRRQVDALAEQEKKTVRKTVTKARAEKVVKLNKREERLFEVFSELMAENNRDNFTASGRPTVYAVSDRVDFDVDSAELDKAWENYLKQAA